MSLEKPLILVAERDPFMRVSLMRALGDHYRITFAESGREVLRLAREYRPALIIMEALLPDLDGFQTCGHLKRMTETRHIPVIFFTVLLAKERALQAGADAFLLKPLRQEEFLQTVERLLPPKR